jgi:transposase
VACRRERIQRRLAGRRGDTPRSERAEGKKPLEAIRCLKRKISDAIYRQLVTDAQPVLEQTGASPGRHCGASLTSSAVDFHPLIDTSDQPLPGPANPTLRPRSDARKSTLQTTG